MKIHIKPPEGEPLTIDAKVTDKVEDIKSNVCKEFGLNASEYHLVASERDLEDTYTLSKYKITNESKLDLEPIPKGEVSIKLLAGKTINIPKVDLEKHTIARLKKKIHDKTGLQSGLQKLVHNKKELVNARTLKDYGIANGSTLLLIPTLTGGYN